MRASPSVAQFSSPKSVVIWLPVTHSQTPPWQSIVTVTPCVSFAVQPQAPLPNVHVGFSQTFVRDGLAVLVGVAGAAGGSPAA